MGQVDEEQLKGEMLRARIKARRKAERAGGLAEEEVGLSLNSMMDMMTIVLLLLLKSYGEEPIKIGSDTDVPFSTSEVRPKDMTTITISRKAIFVNDKRALELGADQKVEPGDKRGGVNGTLILKLEKELQKVVEDRKRFAGGDKEGGFKGEVTIIADSGTPYRTIAEVLQTAIVNEFKEFRFAIVKAPEIGLSGQTAKSQGEE